MLKSFSGSAPLTYMYKYTCHNLWCGLFYFCDVNCFIIIVICKGLKLVLVCIHMGGRHHQKYKIVKRHRPNINGLVKVCEME